jgi:hypothetical protein
LDGNDSLRGSNIWFYCLSAYLYFLDEMITRLFIWIDKIVEQRNA